MLAHFPRLNSTLAEQNNMSKNPRLLQDGNSLLKGLFLGIDLSNTYVEVAYTDYSMEFFPEFPSWQTKWGMRGLLFCESGFGVPYDFDWAEQSRITICPWESVQEIRCMKSDEEVVGTAPYAMLTSYARTSGRARPAFPVAYGAAGELILLCSGNPRSERSAKGRRKPKETLLALLPEVKQRFPRPLSCAFEVAIETFGGGQGDHPDIDRAVPPILDAFKGVVYTDDKQVADVHHRVFKTTDLFVTLVLQTHPTIGLAEITSIPIGSLAPLIWGETDYHVIRLNALI